MAGRFLLFASVGVLAAEFSNSSVGLNSTAAPSLKTCNGPFKHHIHMHAYHIMSNGATSGITNKNAADTLGDMAFIFGSKGVPTPRGVEQYYDGIVEMVHLSVSSWGDYMQCNHGPHDTKYSCKCPQDHKGVCDMNRPGKEENTHTNGHVWYSFPHAGQGKYWDYEHYSNHRGCQNIQIKASCIIDKLAKAAKCPGKCSAKTAKECVTCVNKLSGKEKEHVWDTAVFDGGCPLINVGRRRRTHLQSSSSWDDDLEKEELDSNSTTVV